MADPLLFIIPYDREWPREFEREQSRLALVFGKRAAIEHVGSTAVPGLAAKPIIDVMIGLRALPEAEGRISALEDLGYEYVPAYEVALPDRRYFRKPKMPPRTHHLHCVVRGSAFWREHLLFRDYLRRHPEAAAAYASVKRELAERHGSNRKAYLAGKSPFIERVLALATDEDSRPQLL